jgi:SPW repeat
MVTKRWQDQTSTMLGLWMMVSPWVLDFTGNRMLSLGMPTVPVWAALLFGLAAVLMSVLDIYMHRAWEVVLNFCIGIGLLISPWVLGFGAQSVPATNAMLVGLAMTIISAWSLLEEPDVRHWLHEHHLVR